MTELNRSLDQKIAYGCKGPDPAAPTGSFGAQPFATSQCQVAGRGPKPEFGQFLSSARSQADAGYDRSQGESDIAWRRARRSRIPEADARHAEDVPVRDTADAALARMR